MQVLSWLESQLKLNPWLFLVLKLCMVGSKSRTMSNLIAKMSFDRFLLAVESRDLSQADKSIIRVFSISILQSFNFLNSKIYSYTKNNYLALGNLAKLVFWSISSFKRKSEHLSQFFWWELNLRVLRGLILQKVWTSVGRRQKNNFCYWSLDFGKKSLS